MCTSRGAWLSCRKMGSGNLCTQAIKPDELDTCAASGICVKIPADLAVEAQASHPLRVTGPFACSWDLGINRAMWITFRPWSQTHARYEVSRRYGVLFPKPIVCL